MVDYNINDHNVEVSHKGGPAPMTECPKCQKQTLVQVAGKNSTNFECINCGYKKTVKGPDECFIATTVYGNKNHPSVVILRHFRDEYLHPYRVGRILVSLYYFLGPTMSKYISKSEFITNRVRKILELIVNKIK